MRIGRGISLSGEVVFYATEDGEKYFSCDPETLHPGNPVEIKRLLAPVLPRKIVAVGLNYRDHALELGLDLPKQPVLFMKPSSAVIGPSDDIKYPSQSSRVDYEAELAVVIAKKCKEVKAQDAHEFILGYTCFNDVTARDIQASDGQWTRAKSFDTFAPLGPWIVTNIDDPHKLKISAHLNGELKQNSNTSNLIVGVFDLIEFISHSMTLEKDDIVVTGTPSGIGPMGRGDEISIEIEGIGVLENRVV